MAHSKAVEFVRWLHGATAGERFEYHRGFLASDRLNDAHVSLTAALAFAAQAEGWVRIAQRNNAASEEGTRYIAVRTPKAVVVRPPEHPTHPGSERAAGIKAYVNTITPRTSRLEGEAPSKGWDVVTEQPSDYVSENKRDRFDPRDAMGATD